MGRDVSVHSYISAFSSWYVKIMPFAWTVCGIHSSHDSSCDTRGDVGPTFLISPAYLPILFGVEWCSSKSMHACMHTHVQTAPKQLQLLIVTVTQLTTLKIYT